MNVIQIDEIARYFGRIQELLEENEKLKDDLKRCEVLINEYRNGIKKQQKEHENDILNYRGALKRRQDETHILYHKASTLLGDKKPADYSEIPKWNNVKSRKILQELLDKIEPTNVTLGGQLYTLTKFGVDPNENPVSSYPEQALTFC